MAESIIPKGATTPAPGAPPVRAALELIGSMLVDARAIDGGNPRSWSLIEMAQDLSSDALEVLATHPQDLDAGKFLNIVALLDGARSVAKVMPATAAILNSIDKIADAAAGVVMDWDCGENARRQNILAMEEAMRAARTANTADDYLADPRLALCLDAIQEMDALIENVQRCIDEAHDRRMTLKSKAMMARMRRLSTAIQTGLGDCVATTEEVAAIVVLEVAHG